MFVNLHCHTGIGSMLDSTIFVDEIPKRAKELGFESAAITEHGYLTTAVDFYLSCKSQGVKPIIGCEMYLTNDMNIKDSTSKSYHLILLAKNNEGYENLKELCTRARLDGFYNRPKIDYKLLCKHYKGLICLTACLGGELPKMITSDDYNYDDYIDYIESYEMLFGDDFYLEVQPADNPLQCKVNQELYKLHLDTGIKLVATCDSHFLYKDDFELHNLFINMNQDRDNEVYKDCWYKSEQEVLDVLTIQLGRDIAKESIKNTVEISNKCNLEMDLGNSYLPKVILPKEVNSEDEYIWKLINEGMTKKGYSNKQEYWDRINYEMNIITQKDFIGYFLILADLVKDCKAKDIPIAPARGSAGGSLVADVLDITDIDPIKYGLDFGRFLTIERMSPPDIDTDFASSCRYEAIHMARSKYGEQNVAQVMTFTNMQSKAIIDAIGKLMDVDKDKLSELKKLLIDGKTIGETLVDNKSVPKDLQQLVYYCSRLEGLPRSTSLHAGGLVICPQGHSMSEYSALMLSKEGEITVQCTKDTVEQVGLVKYDFLATSVLDIINDTVKSVGSSYYTFKYDFDDKKVWDYICSGESAACFQIESNMMTDILVKIQPRNIEELCAVISLGRPDTMGEVDKYVARKNGIETPQYYDDILKPILEPTYGTLIYQETIMNIAKIYAGYSDGEADKLRKGLGKKNKDIVKKESDKFLHRALELGRDKDTTKTLASMMSEMGGYLFNKSHGIAYSIVCYMCCYLKYYYPVQFMTSVINNQKKPETGAVNFDKVMKYINAANEMGISIGNPNINVSNEKFTAIENQKAIVYGFNTIKGLSSNSIEVIIANRPYASFNDFLDKVGLQLNKTDLISLVKAGAFDTIEPNRMDCMKALHKFRFMNKKEDLKPIAKVNKTHIKFLLDEGLITPEQQGDKDSCLDIFNYNRSQKDWINFKDKYCNGTELDWEMQVLNSHISGDPFEGVVLPDWNLVKENSVGYLGGVVISVKETTVKNGKSKGQKMAFINLNVKGKIADIVIFSDNYKKYKDDLSTGSCVVIKLEKQGDMKGVFKNVMALDKYLIKTQHLQRKDG